MTDDQQPWTWSMMPASVIQDPALSDTAKVLFAYLDWRAGTSGIAIGRNRAAGELRWRPAKVTKAVLELETADLIEVEQGWGRTKARYHVKNPCRHVAKDARAREVGTAPTRSGTPGGSLSQGKQDDQRPTGWNATRPADGSTGTPSRPSTGICSEEEVGSSEQDGRLEGAEAVRLIESVFGPGVEEVETDSREDDGFIDGHGIWRREPDPDDSFSHSGAPF